MQTLTLAIGDEVRCAETFAAFRLLGTAWHRVRLELIGTGGEPAPFWLPQPQPHWYAEGEWVLLAPGIQVCAAAAHHGWAQFYLITPGTLHILRGPHPYRPPVPPETVP